MIIEQEEFQKKLKRINLAYFSDPDRIITISRGNSVVRQGEQNKKALPDFIRQRGFLPPRR